MAFRKGQWVKLARPVAFPWDTEPVGTVGIHVGPHKDGGVEVHLVDHPSGETRAKVALDEADLVSVTDRLDVPADRLATYAEDWTPQP